jgi:hypothetical protein
MGAWRFVFLKVGAFASPFWKVHDIFDTSIWILDLINTIARLIYLISPRVFKLVVESLQLRIWKGWVLVRMVESIMKSLYNSSINHINQFQRL